MYNDLAISALKNRIGFGPSDIEGIEILPVHIEGVSGRSLPFFHRLATLKNIYNTVEKPLMEEVPFNDFLEQFKVDAVKSVLTAVLDRHKDYKPLFDYSEIIITRPELFDDAMGYTMAISAIEQLISTTRTNYIENSVNVSYQQLKIELDGLISDAGRIQVKGLRRENYYAIEQAIKAIFKEDLYIYDGNFW